MPKEYYIVRYRHLRRMLDEVLPDVKITTLGDRRVVSVNTFDPQTKKNKRSRLSVNDPENLRLINTALQRESLEDQLARLAENWKYDYSGSLEAHCGDYIVKPAEDNPYDSELWESLVNNSYDRPADRSIKHNDLIMKSDFEVEVAKLLESMGIEYKYEGKLILGAQGWVFPDFSLHFPEYNRCAFLEVLGGLDNFAYSKSNAEKINKYINAGLYPNRDVTFIPGDYYYRPDTDSMRRIISTIAESFVQQYVYSGRI